MSADKAIMATSLFSLQGFLLSVWPEEALRAGGGANANDNNILCIFFTYTCSMRQSLRSEPEFVYV